MRSQPSAVVVRRVALAAAVLALVAAVGPASAASDFTWSGATSGQNWSAGGNWSGGTAPSGSVGALSFPALTSSACTADPPTATCYQSQNDLSGITATGVSIDDANHGSSEDAYALTGTGITLGSGGIDAAPLGSVTGFGGASLAFPIALSADQTWSVTGGSNGESLLLTGPVTGGSDTLGVTLSTNASLDLAADDEVGPVTVTGSGTDPGLLELGAHSGTGATVGELNASDGNAVSFTDNAGLLAQPGETGPLTVTGGSIIVGQPGANPSGSQELTVDGDASMSLGTLSMFADQAGMTAGSDYGQLSATGTVTIGSGETLSLGGASGAPPQCPTLHVGDVLTLLSAGSVTGTFTNAAEGSTLPVSCSGGTEPTVQINYTSTTVTATVQTAGGTTPTTTTLQAPSPSSAVSDQPVTLTAQVTAGAGTPSGTVAFLDGGTPINGCSLEQLSGDPATATCQASFGVGEQSITAQYDGGSGFGSSTSSPATALSVTQGATAATLSASTNDPAVGQPVTYTATVAPTQAGDAVEPSGTVAFEDGGTPIAACSGQPLTSGNQSTCTVSYSSAATHTITASYAGDTNFTGSTSPAQTVTVAQPAPGVPVDTAAPTVSGEAAEGQTLTLSQGSWTNGPTSISDQWEDCNAAGAGCTPNGQTGRTDTLSAGDVGHTIRVLETATNASGPGSPAASAPTAVVNAPPLPVPTSPVVQPPAPAPPRGGLTIQAHPQSGVVIGPELPDGSESLPVQTSGSCILSLSEAPATNANLAGAARARRRAKPLGLIRPVRLAVAGAGRHYLPIVPTAKGIALWRRLHHKGTRAHTAAGSTSDPMTVACKPVTYTVVNQGQQVQTGASPQIVPGATISGSPVRGDKLTFDGSFTGTPTALSYQWEDCRGATDECSAIPGTSSDPSDAQTYVVQGSDVGFAIRVLYFATNSAGTTEGEIGPTNVVTGTAIPPQAVFTAEQLLDGDSIVLGGVDLDSYCRLIGYTNGVLEGASAYDFFCVGGTNGQQTPVDFTTACQYEYPGIAVEAVESVTNGGYSWTCREHGTGTGHSGTGMINVPPPPPPATPLCRSFSGSNSAGSVHVSVCDNKVTSLSATTNNGACNAETAQGNSSSPFSDSASIPSSVPVSASGSFGFNFGGSTTFNGQGQVNANGGSATIGIGTGPAAISGGFSFCVAHDTFTLH